MRPPFISLLAVILFAVPAWGLNGSGSGGGGSGTATTLGLNTTSIANAQSPYTVVSTDSVILCSTTAGNVVVNLPAASGSKRILTFIRTTGNDSNTCTITPNGADTINGTNSSTVLGTGTPTNSNSGESQQIEDGASGAWNGITVTATTVGGVTRIFGGNQFLSVANGSPITSSFTLSIASGGLTINGDNTINAGPRAFVEDRDRAAADTTPEAYAAANFPKSVTIENYWVSVEHTVASCTAAPQYNLVTSAALGGASPTVIASPCAVPTANAIGATLCSSPAFSIPAGNWVWANASPTPSACAVDAGIKYEYRMN